MKRFGKGLRFMLCAIVVFVSIGLEALTVKSAASAITLPEPTVSVSGQLAGVTGVVYGDLNPQTGALTSFGSTGAFALDSGLNSIGTDLGSVTAFNTIELRAGERASRLEKSDLSLYISEDNATYSKATDWDFLKLGPTIILYNLSETARYVKIHNHFEDANPEFAGSNLQDMMSVFDLPPGRWTASGGGDWLYRKTVSVTNPNDKTIYDRVVYIEKSTLRVDELINTDKMQSDFRDVRFAGFDGKELPFYMDEGGFHVRIPVMNEQASIEISFYYGNPAASFVGGGQEALQVEYGNKTLMNLGSPGFGVNIKPVRLKDGTLMVIAATDITKGIYAKYSFDDGRTWTAPEPLIDPGDRSNVSLDSPGGAYVDPDTGEVFIIFYSYFYYGVWDGVNSCLHESVCRTDMYVVKSTDTVDKKPVFGTPLQITGMTSSLGNPIHYALTYSNPIRLSTGRLVATFVFVYSDDGALAASVVYSDDDGASWTKSSTDLAMPASGAEGGVSEAAIIELNDGSLRMYLRQQRKDKTVFGTTFSADQGMTWSALEDSDIMSTNTLPAMSRDADDTILFNWSGHNAMGMTSNYRNNLTLAYSDDETLSWKGYRDLLGRTSLSTPGWYAENWVTESDKVPVGDDSYLFAWSGTKITGLLIEDFYRYLHSSHGASDDFEYVSGGAAPDHKKSLSNDYWWQSTRPGIVEVSRNQAKQGERSLRLFDNVDNQAITSASRLFPAVAKGSVSYSVYGESFDNGLYMSAQEAYSQHWNAAGTAFLLRVSPEGKLQYSDVTEPATLRKVGFLAGDTNPSKGNLGHFGFSGKWAFDYRNRSLGVDFGRVEQVTEIKLFGENANNRLSAGNISIYASNTNESDWQLVSGWTLSKQNATITISNLSVQTQYIKVAQSFSDDNFTFANLLQDMIEVQTGEASRQIGYLNNDTDPSSGNIRNFGFSQLFGFDYLNRSIGIDLGKVETVQTIKLWDNDGVNRLTASDLSVYASNTNAGGWVPVSGWTFSKTNGNIVLGGMSVQARYIKVHQSYPDTAFTFVNGLQDMMTVQTAEHNPVTGFLNGDTNPLAGNLSNFTYTGPVALDYGSRSVGVDLGRVETIKEIRLRDSDGTNRLTSGDLSVYTSDTNAGDWTEITGWTFNKTGGTITLSGLSADARYVKVHQRYTDTAYTFGNELQNMMTVKTVPAVPNPFHDLPVPTSLPLHQWSDIRLDFDLADAAADVYVNGVHKGRIPAAHPGTVVTHFLLSSGAGAGTDAYLDEFIVQDKSVELPAAGAIGAEQSAVSYETVLRATGLSLIGTNTHGTANALTAKLRHAETAEKEGKEQVKLASIRAYMKQVESLAAEGKISRPAYLIQLAGML